MKAFAVSKNVYYEGYYKPGNPANWKSSAGGQRGKGSFR